MILLATHLNVKDWSSFNISSVANEEINFCVDTDCTKSLQKECQECTLSLVNFWLGGVTQSVIACFGIFGNLISITIFGQRKLRNTFHLFLVVLAFWDLGYLILTLIEEIFNMYDIINQGKSFHHPNYVPTGLYTVLYPKFIHPFKSIFLMASEYFTVVISIDRYFAIMYPNCRRIGFYSAVVFMWSLLYCFSMFFEIQKIEEDGTIILKNSDLYENKVYGLIYYLICDSIFKIWIPVCILLYTNYCIHKVVKKQSKVIVFGDEHYTYNKKVQFLMLFGVVILLTITNLYRFCTNIHALSIHHYLECCMVHIGNEIAITIASVFATFSSSVNCFVYVAASKDFRSYVLEYIKRPLDLFRQCKKRYYIK